MSAVIDAAALPCVLLAEPGTDLVLPVLRGAHISAVDVSERCARRAERGSTIAAVMRTVQRFELVVHPFDLEAARSAAELPRSTKSIGASLGDRACISVGRRLRLPIFTGDRRMSQVDPALGTEIRLIR